ncbi:MAG TPA: hypothetical protein VNZ59_05935 [Burkholderiales bacterium]|nr:hypothetical protein [Burkholderiales bacterium]
MTTRLARFVFLVFGLIAVSALLAQPICEAAEREAALASDTWHVAASGGDEGDPYCCPVAAPEALVAASLLTGGPSIPAVVPAVVSPVVRAPIVISDALPASALAPPFFSSYYLRTARIQR